MAIPGDPSSGYARGGGKPKPTAAPTGTGGTTRTPSYSGVPYTSAGSLGYVAPPVMSPSELGLTDLSQFVSGLADIAKVTVPGLDAKRINKTAASYAAQDIAERVADFRRQQKDLLSTGKGQAGLINAAGREAANLTSPWAQSIFNAYNTLGQQAYDVAKGYSGETQAAALADAEDVRSQLALLDSAQDPGGTRAAALGNTLRGLGNLTGGTLGQQGAAAMVGAYGIPQGMLGYAQSRAAGTLGSAMQEAAKLNPEISAVQAQRGKLTREYISTLTDQAQAQRDFSLKQLAYRADLISGAAGIAGQSNEAKLAYAKYQQDSANAYNQVVQATNEHAATIARINEEHRANMAREGLSAAELAETSRYHDEQIRVADAELEASKAEASNKLDASFLNAQTSQARMRGWYWLGQGPNARAVAAPGKKLVYDKQGNFTGRAVNDLSQTKSAKSLSNAIKFKDMVAINKYINTNLGDWIFGKPPPPDKNTRGKGYTTPGWDSKKQEITDPQAYYGAGGTSRLNYWDVVRRVVTESGGLINEQKARALVDPIFRSRNTNPYYAAQYNMKVGDPIPEGAVPPELSPGLRDWQR